MKGDFTRVTFDPAKQYTRVLMQQGRVQLDADWNEQADILLYHLRALAADLIGPFGAPPGADGTAGRGFKLVARRKADGHLFGLFLLPGRYYVDGIAARNTTEWPVPKLDPGARFLLYLDVWERHVTYLQDDLLREVALLGPDTATRSKVVWRMGSTHEIPQPIRDLEPDLTIDKLTCRAVRRHWRSWVEQLQPPQRGRLKARARPGTPDDTDPCLSSPEARYRGENQLYRVEIHAGAAKSDDTATFKWSADNGSVVFPVRAVEPAKESDQTTVILEHLGRGEGSGLIQDDWVEIVGGTEDLRQGTDPLLQVASVDAERRRVVLKGKPPSELGQPWMLRRWDHRRGIARKALKSNGVYPVVEGEWLDLEDGVQIFFDKPPQGTFNAYRSGDYWLIPARVATGDVEWPGPPDAPESRPPHGVEHHYAPLGLLTVNGDNVEYQDCRTTFGTTVYSLSTGVADWQLMAEQSIPGVYGKIPRPADIVLLPDNAWDLIPGAHWISSNPRRAADFPTGDYTFELRFDLCACFHHPRIWFYLLADDKAEIFLNKTSIGKHAGFNNTPFHYEETKPAKLLVDGENLLTVVVNNVPKDTPMGFILHGAVEDDCRCR